MPLTTLVNTEGKERVSKWAEQSRWVGGGLNKLGNLHSRLVLGGCNNLRVCVEALTRVSHYTVQMVSTPHSPKALSLKRLWLWERWAEHTFQGQGWE